MMPSAQKPKHLWFFRNLIIVSFLFLRLTGASSTVPAWVSSSGWCVDSSGREAGRGGNINGETDAGCLARCQEINSGCTAYTLYSSPTRSICILYTGAIVGGQGDSTYTCTVKPVKYKMTSNGEYCPAGQSITSEADCRSAAAALGKTFKHAWRGANSHAYCLYADDGRAKVYFNTAEGGGGATPHRAYASLCDAVPPTSAPTKAPTKDPSHAPSEKPSVAPTPSPIESGWKVCAYNDNEYSKMCACNGVAVFGRKFLSGKPGAGTKASIEQLRQMGHMEIGVAGQIECTTAGFTSFMSQAACRTVVTDTSLASSARLLLGVTDDTFPLQSQIDSGMAAPAAGCTVELQADKLAVWWTEADIADAWTNPFKTVFMNSNLELVESGVEPLPGFNKYCMCYTEQPQNLAYKLAPVGARGEAPTPSPLAAPQMCGLGYRFTSSQAECSTGITTLQGSQRNFLNKGINCLNGCSGDGICLCTANGLCLLSAVTKSHRMQRLCVSETPNPTAAPTAAPTAPTQQPTLGPTRDPTTDPTKAPTAPTPAPTLVPTTAPTMPKRDCKVEKWSHWSVCSKECGGGEKIKTRRMLLEPLYGGTPCPTLVQAVPCNQANCVPVHCVVSEWGRFSACTLECGTGDRFRTRTILTHPEHKGWMCPNLKETQPCNVIPCHNDCHAYYGVVGEAAAGGACSPQAPWTSHSNHGTTKEVEAEPAVGTKP